MRRLDRLEALTMTWLILFLGARFSPECRSPITGDGAPSWSDVDEVSSAPGRMGR